MPGVGTFQLFDVGAVVATCGLVAAFLAASIVNGRALAELEPRPGRQAGRRRNVGTW